MINRRSRFLLGAGLLLVILAVSFQAASKLRSSQMALHRNLLSKLPAAFLGWTVIDRPIATTPEMQRAVDEMLNYSSAIFREYSREGRSLSIYIAYWEPGKFNPRLIGEHTPDICWVGNGWKLVNADYNYSVQIGATTALPAQYRLFSIGGTDTHVLYWHIVDRELSGYASGPISASNSFLKNFVKDVKNGVGEQFFIRLSSPQPWSEWASDPLFVEILNTLSPVMRSSSSSN